MQGTEVESAFAGVSSQEYIRPSFSLGNRVARAVWGVAYALLFRPSPRPLHAWRRWLLRCFGAQLGKGCRIYPHAMVWAPWNLICADEVSVANGTHLYNQAPIELGYRSIISQGSHICTGTHNYRSPQFELVAHPIRIGKHAWVCADVFIGPGISIGDGAVIGARSVVVKDMPAWTVCAGHPCKPLKPREMERGEETTTLKAEK
jgi:putative colanic acid biosynthesis acetyltransferase WcaF